MNIGGKRALSGIDGTSKDSTRVSSRRGLLFIQCSTLAVWVDGAEYRLNKLALFNRWTRARVSAIVGMLSQ
jgi:hypothetical protein